MRKQIETEFEMRSNGLPLISWMVQQRNAGQSLRAISAELSQRVGVAVSHESVRKWLRDG